MSLTEAGICWEATPMPGPHYIGTARFGWLRGLAMQHFTTRFRLTLYGAGSFLEMADDRQEEA
jgi:hypothetical protein